LNNRGLYSFLLVIGYSVLLLAMLSARENSIASFREAKNSLLEAEIINLHRTIVEENIDRVIRERLAEQLTKTSDAGIVKSQINNTLLLLLKEIEKNHAEQPMIRFYSASGKAIDKNFLEKISKVLVIDTRENKTEGEYYIIRVFGGGETLLGKISGKNFEGEFKLPEGYSVKAVVAR